jgi:hypothetical protein
MQLAYALKPKQQVTELIFPAKHPLDGMEPLFEDGRIEERLTASLGGFSTARIGIDVGDHAAIENGFPVLLASIDAVQANDGSSEVEANRMGDAGYLRQGFAQQRRFIAITGRRNKWCDHIAIPVAESDDLIAFHLLMTAEPDVIAAFLRRSRRPITMNDGCVEKIGLMKARYGAGENGVKTAIRLPSSKGAINACIMNFGTALYPYRWAALSTDSPGKAVAECN